MLRGVDQRDQEVLTIRVSSGRGKNVSRSAVGCHEL